MRSVADCIENIGINLVSSRTQVKRKCNCRNAALLRWKNKLHDNHFLAINNLARLIIESNELVLPDHDVY